MRRPGQALSRLQLLEHAWDFAYENRSNVIDVYVRYLREKIDRPFGVRSLETVRGVGLPPARGDRMSRLPIRTRLTLVFTVAMAVVLAAMGIFVYTLVARDLSAALDRELRSRAQDLSALVERDGSLEQTGSPFVEHGEAFAELLATDGRVLDATPTIGAFRLLNDPELERAAAGPSFVDRESVPGLDEPARMLAVPVDDAGCSSSERHARIVRRRSRACVTHSCLEGLSHSCSARSAAISSQAPRCGRSRRCDAGGRDLDLVASRAPASAPRPRRGRATRRDAQRDAGSTRGRSGA